MCDIYNSFDADIMKERIKEVRKLRQNQYNKDKHKYKIFECCQTQEKLAKKLGVNRQTISAWENGNRIPPLDTLIELCNALNCSIDYLLGANDHPEIAPIAKASHYSGISPQIIRYGREHSDYLDCLNFFMLPENCSNLFNKLTLMTWKKYQINSLLKDIKSPLKEDILRFYDEYNAVTPFNEHSPRTYRAFLKAKLPKEKLIISSQKNKDVIKIKKYFNLITYKKFLSNNKFNYNLFIDYLVDYTFKPLSDNAMIELQKEKLSHAFVNLFTKYLEEL